MMCVTKNKNPKNEIQLYNIVSKAYGEVLQKKIDSIQQCKCEIIKSIYYFQHILLFKSVSFEKDGDLEMNKF